MRRVGRRGITGVAAFLGALVLAAPVAGCASTAETGKPVPRPVHQSGQELFKVDLLSDVSALDSGVLGYQAPVTMQTGAQATLIVEVTDIGQGGPGTAPLPSGFVYARQDVPTGAIVGVQASCQDVTCDTDTSERQPVLMSAMTGTWSWTISALSPGTAHMVLVATTYDQNTDIPLHVTAPIDIAITVTATPGYWVSEAGDWTKAVLGFIGFGAIASAVQWLWRHRRKQKKGTPSDPKEPVEPPEPAKSP
jgi:hypothetical protein